MIPHIKGRVTKQAHVGIPDGTYEEEYARDGFFGRYAHLYRAHPPVNWSQIEGPLRPQAYDLAELQGVGGDYIALRKVVLKNDDVEIAILNLNQSMPYFFRNADADEVFFIHAGNGRLETDFGPVDYAIGDYIVVPRGTVFRFNPDVLTSLLNITSFSEIGLPEKGLLGQHALFDPAMIRVPSPEDAPKGSEGQNYEVRIRRRGEITRVTYPFYPIDVVGWKGTLTVWQLNVKDIRPILSDQYHLPPSAHCTFVARGFVICTFLPRPLENGDPKAVKVPFYHSNIDFDEVLFYHEGQFFSRAGIHPGMLTFHPQGIQHGPQGDAVARTQKIERTNEIAVMIDTKRPLYETGEARSVEVKDYWKSWMTQNQKGNQS